MKDLLEFEVARFRREARGNAGLLADELPPSITLATPRLGTRMDYVADEFTSDTLFNIPLHDRPAVWVRWAQGPAGPPLTFATRYLDRWARDRRWKSGPDVTIPYGCEVVLPDPLAHCSDTIEPRNVVGQQHRLCAALFLKAAPEARDGWYEFTITERRTIGLLGNIYKFPVVVPDDFPRNR